MKAKKWLARDVSWVWECLNHVIARAESKGDTVWQRKDTQFDRVSNNRDPAHLAVLIRAFTSPKPATLNSGPSPPLAFWPPLPSVPPR